MDESSRAETHDSTDGGAAEPVWIAFFEEIAQATPWASCVESAVVLAGIFQRDAGQATPLLLALEDSSLSLEFENNALGRVVIYAIPPDGAPHYLIVQSREGQRAGIVRQDAAHAQLALWLAGRVGALPVGGIEWA